ncbi:MAG: hypothetical protein ACE37H_09170 [Phycisphaeraceae bacterium]
MNAPGEEQPVTQPFEQARQVGTVELDRYCAACGYNLRQQAIRRDPATRLLLCQCPECGAFEPANTLTTATRGWFRGLVVFAWLVWLVLWLNLVGWSVFGVTALAVVSGDTRQQWVEIENVNPNDLVENDAIKNYRQQVSQHNAAGHAGPMSFYKSNAMALRPMRSDDKWVLGLCIALAAAIGGVMTTITAVAIPHWPRWGYVLFACAWPLVGVFIFHALIWPELYDWRIVTVGLMQWHLRCAITIQTTALATSLLAVWLGRPVARGVIRLIVPPNRRGAFAYLWLADGKTQPKTA